MLYKHFWAFIVLQRFSLDLDICSKSLPVSMTMTSLDSQWTLSCLLLLFLATVTTTIDVRNMTIDEYVNYINPPAVCKFQVSNLNLITSLKY
jgi:hypothetical protein